MVRRDKKDHHLCEVPGAMLVLHPHRPISFLMQMYSVFIPEILSENSPYARHFVRLWGPWLGVTVADRGKISQHSAWQGTGAVVRRV